MSAGANVCGVTPAGIAPDPARLALFVEFPDDPTVKAAIAAATRRTTTPTPRAFVRVAATAPESLSFW
ncbi:MAG: hypothetical protein JO176_07830 [Acidimicrobiia bacterium]|nr:hypothetical protein [Acidimicrobiia bacterium]